MAQQNNPYLQTPELQNEFYQRYVQRIHQEALGLTGNQANATKLTETVFAQAYEHFSTRPVSPNSEIYLLMQTNRLFAKTPEAFLGADQGTPLADTNIEPVYATMPEGLEDASISGRAMRTRRERVQETNDALQGLPFSFDDVGKPFVPQVQGQSATSAVLMPATFYTSHVMPGQQPPPMTDWNPPVVPVVPMVETPPVVQAPPAMEVSPVVPAVPVIEIPPAVPISRVAPITESQASDPLVFNNEQTLHWTPDMDVSTDSVASTSAPPEDPSTRRSVVLSIINTILFLLTVAAVGFLLYELGVFSLFG